MLNVQKLNQNSLINYEDGDRSLITYECSFAWGNNSE